MKTGAKIYSILSQNEEVTGYLGTKIYPLILPQETKLPALVFKRSFDKENSKDRLGLTNVTVEITVLDTDYSRSINICHAVHAALMGSSDIDIKAIRLVSGDEAVIDDSKGDTYLQMMVYDLKVV